MTKFILLSLIVTATVYNADPKQCNADYLTTASLKKIDRVNPSKHRWIAVSRDLEKLGYTFGTEVIVECCCEYDGVWTVEDRMNKRYTKRIDFLVDNHIKLGKWDSVTIRKYKKL
jgi:3D (Asp-Asp-Asp) domain-containing protein